MGVIPRDGFGSIGRAVCTFMYRDDPSQLQSAVCSAYLQQVTLTPDTLYDSHSDDTRDSTSLQNFNVKPGTDILLYLLCTAFSCFLLMGLLTFTFISALICQSR